jgi:hypothetical protein
MPSTKPSASKQSAAPKHKEAQTAPPQPPRSVDELRMELLRKVSLMVNNKSWRTCRQPACGRHRRCTAPAPHYNCSNTPPRPPLTPDQEAAARASLFHGVRRRLAELGREVG